MRLFDHARVRRAAVLACGLACCLAWFGPATSAVADPLADPLANPSPEPASLKLTFDADEPFGLPATPIYYGGLRNKWLGVAHKLEDERVQLALCDGDREHCASDAALKFLSIVDSGRQRDGRARLGEINRAINLSIRAVDDIVQHGQIDVWSSPLATFYRGAGDCEDYAIAKYFSLVASGMPVSKLRLVYVRAQLGGQVQAHMVLAYYVSPGAEPLILDSLVTEVRPASRRPDLTPVFSFNSEGLWQGVGAQSAGDPVARLSRWREVLLKVKEEGFL